MKIAIIINANRFPDDLKQTLDDPEFSKRHNLTYDLFILEAQNIDTFFSSLNHQSYNAYLIGGGDGTVRSVIQHIMNIPNQIPIAILPLGTFNLLAKSLDHPNDIESLLTIIKNNKTKLIDIAEVNGHVIINHAWIGFYYHLLKLRKKHRDFLGKSKLLKIIFNTLNVFKVIPIYTLKFKVDNEIQTFKTCLVFIGNNESYTNLFDFGEHKTLSSGLLSINILKCQTRFSLFKCLLTILFKSFKNNKYVTTFNAEQLEITSNLKIVKTVIDGELFEIESPLNFDIHHKKLTVLVP